MSTNIVIDPETIKETILEKVHFQSGMRIPFEMLQVKLQEDVINMCTEVVVQWWVLGKVHREHSVESNEYLEIPDGWWQTLKERYFPRLLKKVLPIKRRRIVIKHKIETKEYRLCPHLGVPRGDVVHIRWLEGLEKKEV